MSVDRLPPFALEAEQAVLGSCLIDRDGILEVAEIVTPDDFYRPQHGTIYGAMLRLFAKRQPIDVVSLPTELEAVGRLEEIGGSAYLTSLVNLTPTSVNVEHYARVVADAALRRRVIEVAGKIAAVGYEERSGAECLDRAQSLLFGIERKDPRRWMTIQSLLTGAYDHLESLQGHKGEVTGIPSGFPDLDELTGGFQRSDLIILAARPSVGKTSLALNVAEHAALAGHTVAMFSLEMSAQQLALRVLSSRAGVDAARMRTGDLEGRDFTRIATAIEDLRPAAIHVDDSSTLTPVEMRVKARRLQAQDQLGLIIVDYLQLQHVPRSPREQRNRVAEVSEISRELKQLARELDVPVLALSQLSRESDREQRPPRLSDLRDSGSIEQDADVVIFLWRDKESSGDTETQAVKLRVAKHRNGPTGYVDLTFDKRHTRFLVSQAGVWS